MASYTLSNAMLLAGDQRVPGCVRVEGERIAAVAEKMPLEGKIIDCKGMLLLPGFIDVHTHMRDPGLTHKEDFMSGGLAAARGGFTTVADMPNTIPPVTDFDALGTKRIAAKQCPVHVRLWYGAVSGNTEDMEPLRDCADVLGVKVFLADSTGSLKAPYEVLKKALENYYGVVAIHAEDDQCLKDSGGYTDDVQDTVHYLKARPGHCGIAAVMEALKLVEETKGRLHVCHVTTAGEVDLIRAAKKQKLNISAEVTPHHLWFTAETASHLESFAKVNPPLRTARDVEALWEGLRDGTIDMIASDHAPHTREEKNVPFAKAPAGVPGLETSFPAVYTGAIKRAIPLSRIVDAFTGAPARRFSLKGAGSLQEGSIADLTVVDTEDENPVFERDLKTKCGWSPFAGLLLRGWPQLTIVSGKIVYTNLT